MLILGCDDNSSLHRHSSNGNNFHLKRLSILRHPSKKLAHRLAKNELSTGGQDEKYQFTFARNFMSNDPNLVLKL